MTFKTRQLNIKTDKDRCTYLKSLEYPKNMRALPYTKDCDGVVLMHKKEGIVGYSIIDKVRHSLRDIHVIKKHRGEGTKILMKSLFNIMLQYGNKWQATVNQDTSLKLLKKLEEKGYIKLTVLGESRVRWEGIPMLKVSFTIKSKSLTENYMFFYEILFGSWLPK